VSTEHSPDDVTLLRLPPTTFYCEMHYSAKRGLAIARRPSVCL